MTTTYLVRDPYPSTLAATEIQCAMSAAGWTLLDEPPNAPKEDVSNGALIHLRMRVEDIGIVDWEDILAGHYAVQLWTDSAGNVVRYIVTRRCSQEAAGLHSVYLTVTAMYRTATRWQAYRDRMRAEARKQQEPADRVSPAPTPTARPTPVPKP